MDTKESQHQKGNERIPIQFLHKAQVFGDIFLKAFDKAITISERYKIYIYK